MIGHETTWIPAALRVLREQLPHLRVVISTQNSPQLAVALSDGRIDVAFLRSEDGGTDLEYRTLVKESFEVFLPEGHRLAQKDGICVQELVGETFLSISGTALSIAGKQPALRRTIDRYLKQNGVALRPSHEVDNLGAVMSLIVSTGGVALLPRYAKTFLLHGVATRPLIGPELTIDLSLGFKRGNASPVLREFLAQAGELAVS
jgi:LysR family hca operon transcriptional activator